VVGVLQPHVLVDDRFSRPGVGHAAHGTKRGPERTGSARQRPTRLGPVTYVFDFSHEHAVSPMSLKDLLGGKGANLAEMTSVLGLPVPHGFTITTDACRAYMDGGWPAGLS